MPYYPPQLSGSETLEEVSTNPSSPTLGQSWILRQGNLGQPIGLLLSLTSDPLFYLCVETTSGIKEVQLI